MPPCPSCHQPATKRQVLDVLFRDHRDTESATAFFRRTLGHTGTVPTPIISDHHQPYVAA